MARKYTVNGKEIKNPTLIYLLLFPIMAVFLSFFMGFLHFSFSTSDFTDNSSRSSTF